MNVTEPHRDDSQSFLPQGTRVEVWNAFDRSWSKGFTVTALVDGRYRIKRRTDGSELPGSFAIDEVRKEHKRSTWWI